MLVTRCMMATIVRAVIIYITEWFNRFTESLNGEMNEIMGEVNQSDVKEEEGCTDNGQTYRQGEVWSDPGECNHKVCHRRGVISVRKCPEWKFKPPCRQVQLHSKYRKFPECCASIVCCPNKVDKK